MYSMHNLLKVAVFGSVIAVASYGVYNFESQKSALVKQTQTETKIKGKAVSGAPNFTEYTDVNEKKHAFFSYLKPGIALENQRVLKERERLIRIKNDLQNDSVSESDLENAKHLGRLYQVELTNNEITSEWVDNMLHRADVIPEALVLTQAANESAWGTSRLQLLPIITLVNGVIVKAVVLFRYNVAKE